MSRYVSIKQSPCDPVYTLTQKSGGKLGYEAEAFAIYDTMRYVKPPIFTVCVGNAFGEAAMLLAAGEKVRACCRPWWPFAQREYTDRPGQACVTAIGDHHAAAANAAVYADAGQ